MRHNRLVGCGLALAVALVAAAAPAPTPAPAASPADPAGQPATAPRIVFDKTELDLGDVLRGKDATATFTYRNTGSAPLRILSAKPG